MTILLLIFTGTLMYQLFTSRYNSSNSVIHHPGFELIKRTYQREVSNIVEYFNSRVYAVKSNHLLCRLLNTANVPFDYNLYRFTEVANIRAPYISKHFNFTSSINHGKVFNGVFYGEDSKEIIITNDESFNPDVQLNNWRNIKAVRVIDHVISDLGILLPNGNNNTSDKGIAIIEINIPLLLVQYRGFVTSQYSKVNKDSVLSMQHFVHMYVLPNMLYSHIELVILNRMMNIFNIAPMGESLKKYPFPIINYANKIDRILIEVIEHIENKKLLYNAMLKNIPSIFDEDMQSVLLMPDIAKTNQVWWALLLSKLRVITFLINIGGKESISNNRSYINKLKLELKTIHRENIIYNVFDKNTAYDIRQNIEYILSL